MIAVTVSGTSIIVLRTASLLRESAPDSPEPGTGESVNHPDE
jgi:hypothetical protein